jgi:hypothetical protein
LHLIILVELCLSDMVLLAKNQVEIAGLPKQQQSVCEFPLDVCLFR